MYKISENQENVIRISDGAIIPQDHNNVDYVGYLAWLDQGNEVEQPEVIIVIPQTVTVAQGGLALIESGLMEEVQAVIETLREDPVTNAALLWAWDKATEWNRNSPSLTAVAQAAGMTEEQLDDLFILAESMVA